MTGENPQDVYSVRPIGTISTPFDDTNDPPRQGVHRDADGTIHLDRRYAPGLEGLAVGTFVDVVWFAHRSDRNTIRARDCGVFSTRSPERPNPICVTSCGIESIADHSLVVSGVDMIDGTPLLDLKCPME